MSTVYWIGSAQPARLAIVARPRGNDWLEDEIKNLRKAGIEVLVSALTRVEAEELGLKNESEHCKMFGIEWITLPIEDRSVPEVNESFANAIRHLADLKRRGKAIGVHCRAGIGRSSMVAAFLLVQDNLEADEAFSQIGVARGCPVPDTDEQRTWVRRHTEKLRELAT